MAEITIRQIARSEIPCCVALIRESFLTVADELGLRPETSPKFTGFSISEQRLCYHFDVEKRPMICAEIGGEIAGYYSLAPLKCGACEINNLAVPPRFRHDGVGGELLRDALLRAKSMGASEAEVSIVVDNLRLRRWYEAKGFCYIKSEKFDGFAFTCGTMTRRLDDIKIDG